MKKEHLLLLTLYIIIISSDTYPQWMEQDLPSIENNLYSVFFSNDSIGYIAGEQGFLLQSIDKGKTWEASSKASDNLRSIHGYRERKWAVGNKGLILYNDSFEHNFWYKQQSNVTAELKDVFFIDYYTGWIAGRAGTILCTTNGGEEWILQNSGTTLALNSVFFTDEHNGYAAGNDGTILRTTNGGLEWSEQIIYPDYTYSEILFTDDSTGFIAGGNNNGLRGKILKTTDRGETWTTSFDTGQDEFLYSIIFLNDNDGFAAGYKGTLYKTTNGGEDWNKLSAFTGRTIYSLFYTGDEIYTSGYAGVNHRSSDEGMSWRANKSFYNLKTIFFMNKDTGWAAGSSGIVISTTNGGSRWNMEKSEISSDISTIFFVDSLQGYCAGANGLILRSTNGGSTWDTTYILNEDPYYYDPRNYGYNSVYFSDEDNGVAAGYLYEIDNPFPQPVLSITSDGGRNWETKSDFPGSTFNDVHFIDKDHGWAAGMYVDGYGWVFKTTDGGITWDDITPDSLILLDEMYRYNAANFRNIFFVNKDTGWVAGDNNGRGFYGFIFATFDGGRTWTEQRAERAEVADIHFADSEHGWAVENAEVDHFTSSMSSRLNSGLTAQLVFRRNPHIRVKNYDHRTKLKLNKAAYTINYHELKGRILETSNSGEDWSAKEFDTALNAIYSTDADHVWAAGNGKIFHYSDEPVPVEMSSFTAELDNQRVKLCWKTQTEINNKQFEIERNLSGRWEMIAIVEGKGTTAIPSIYYYTDDLRYVSSVGIILYRIRQVDYNGSFRYSGQVEIEADLSPKGFALYQNYPNPFNPSTMIKYAVPEESKISVEIFNSVGEKIGEIDEGVKSAGYYEVTWNSENLSSGIYYYTITAAGSHSKNSFRNTKKMILLR